MTLVTLTNHLNQNHHHHHHHHNCDRTCNNCANNLNLNMNNNNNNNNINREEITYQHSVIPEAASHRQLEIISKQQQQTTNTTSNMSNQHTNEQSLLITSNHQQQQQPRRHKNSTASSVDPYSSLNLSSMGSSSNSSAQHSPLLVNEVNCKNINNNNKELSSQLLAEQLASSCRVATSDYSRATSISCSPTTSPISCELLEESSSSNDAGEAQENLCDHNSKQQQQQQQELSSHQTNHLHLPSSGASCQQQQKVRSFSHSTTFSPLIVSPTPSSGRHSTIEVKEEDQQQQQQQQPLSEVIIERPRRLSRIEHRQSLLDLGYGKIESYFKLQRLGKGTYATVYMGRSRLSNDLVALKEILKEHDEGAPCTAIREVSLLRLLRHNNIVTLHDICHTPKKLTLVFEYVGPDLYAYMKKNNNLLSIHNVRILLYQLLRGISFCHSRQVLHRDLKPQNLLINSRGELKICDFGLARAKSIPTKSYSNEVVTLWYRPPDVLLGNTDYDHSIDMWGVGCIFYEMASGRTFFPGSSVRQQLYLIFSSLGAPNKYNWPEILTNPDYQSYSFPPFRPEKLSHRVPRLDSNGVILLMSFLRFKPQERISAEEARRDPFFACLPEAVHQLGERESILDVPGVYMTLNPGQKLNHHI